MVQSAVQAITQALEKLVAQGDTPNTSNPNIASGVPRQMTITKGDANYENAGEGNAYDEKKKEATSIDLLNSKFLPNWRKQMAQTPEAYGNKNVAKGDAKYNANALGPKATLEYSRMADALNNEIYLTPGRAGNLGAVLGGGTSGSYGVQHQLEKMPQIETEEMRQQRDIANLSKTQSERMIRRQQNAKDVPVDIQKEQLLEKLAEEGIISRDNLDYYKTLNLEQLRQNVIAPYNVKMQQAVEAYSRVGIPEWQAQRINELQDQLKGIPANLLGQLFGIVSIPYDMLVMDQILQEAFRDGGTTEEKLYRLSKAKGMAAVTTGAAAGSGMVERGGQVAGSARAWAANAWNWLRGRR